MKNVHLILPDLFLPKQFAAEVSAELVLPALQKLLARATRLTVPAATHNVESALCAAFGVVVRNDVPIAPISAAFDGLGAGCWLRADPVHLALQRDRMLLSQAAVTDEEAKQFCASLNGHFAGQGMTFFAPHALRWYVRLDQLPDMQTTPLSEVIGSNVRGALPQGTDARHWHQVFNEIQMLMFSHPLNEAREARGETAINSVWLWGGGCDLDELETSYDTVSSDEAMAEMFAAAAGLTFSKLAGPWRVHEGRQLVLHTALHTAIQAGDLHAWRAALQSFETDHAQPLWDALRSGDLARLQIDVLAGENTRSMMLERRDTWRFWRRSRRLAAYSMV